MLGLWYGYDYITVGWKQSRYVPRISVLVRVRFVMRRTIGKFATERAERDRKLPKKNGDARKERIV